MSQPRHPVSVAAVITNDHDRVLVIQRRDNGAWQIPGGILELDETVEDGLSAGKALHLVPVEEGWTVYDCPTRRSPTS